MGKWVHRLSNIDETTAIGDCAECGNGVRMKWRKTKKQWVCHTAHIQRRHTTGVDWFSVYSTGSYRRHLKDFCERCGFVPLDKCMLEIDHINGRNIPKPHDPSNLQTLCANCHRLKTFRPDLFSMT